MMKLNIGCGDLCFDGWVNIDLDSPSADLLHDVRKKFPYEDCAVNYIYNEHFIEHLALDEGRFFLSETFRILKIGGVLRVATPDLDYIIEKYTTDWKNQKWIEEHGYQDLSTNAEMINLSFREWGHKYIYNRTDLIKRLEDAGFSDIKAEAWGSSEHECFKNKESRSDSLLVLEATKTSHPNQSEARASLKKLEQILNDRILNSEQLGTHAAKIIEDLEKTIYAKNQHTVWLETRLAEEQNHIQGLEAGLTDKDRHIQGLEAGMIDRDRHIQGLETAVKNLEKWIIDTQQRIPLRLFRIKCDLI